MKRKLEDELEKSDNGEVIKVKSTSELKPSGNKKLKAKAKSKDREFSMKEISKLKTVETLFHSSLLRMQVAELQKNVSLKQNVQSRIESAVRFLSKKLLDLPSEKEYSLKDRSWLDTSKINLPIVEGLKDTKGVFQFVPPSEVHLIGSVNSGTCVKPHVAADLAVLLPEEFFQTNDGLNQRYFKKKALYLAALASHLSQWEKVVHLNYEYLVGNPLSSVLVVTVKGKDSKTTDIKLHVMPKSHKFKLFKFHIRKNNVRPKWFFDEKTMSVVADQESEDATDLPATKHYNSTILQDLCKMANEEFLKETIYGSDGLKEGLILLKIWLHQRELSQGYGMFSNFLMTAYVAYLTKIKKLNKIMSGFQVFKTTLVSLTKADWQVNPPTLYENIPNKNAPKLEEYKEAFDCVFIDCTGSYNLAYMLDDNIFKRVQDECKASLALMEQPEQAVFDALFMVPVAFVRKFDHIFHVRIDKATLNRLYTEFPEMKDTELDLGLSCRTLSIERLICSILRKALGRRATLLQAKPTTDTKWNTSCKAYEYDRRSYITLGLVLDPVEAYNILDKGPSADAAEAQEFRAFWGEKSEMRRFKDGSIHEAVLWTTSSNQKDKRIICNSIILHILKEHFGIRNDNVVYLGNPLDSLLEISPKNSAEISSYGTGEEVSLNVLKAFEQLSRIVRVTSDLPLSVSSVQGVHPVFRNSEVFPPLPTGLRISRSEATKMGQQVPCDVKALPPFIPVLPVVCELEGSGKWPDDKEAMAHMKVLLHVKLGQELKDKFDMCVRTNSNYIDVYQSGFVFRLMLACSREIAVLRTLQSESGMLRFEDTKESLALERDTVALPLLSHLIHSVQQEHFVFSPTVRLCKRWLASQMIWNQLRDEAVELIVASLFINPQPYSVPGSPAVGFMRFLHLFSTFDWENEVFMVNLNNEFSDLDYSEIPQNFKVNRNTLPAMCIATPQDKKGNMWTNEGPEKSFLDRFIILAASSLRNLEHQLLSHGVDSNYKKIFRPVIEHFDVAIKLQKHLNVLHYQAVDAKGDVLVNDISKGLYTSKHSVPVLDFDVYLRFLQDLQDIYGHLAYFFFDRFGGRVIGMVWKSHALIKKDFRSSNFSMRRPTYTEEEKASLDILKDSVLEDIKIIGSGIIESVVSYRSGE